jgi:hypothetical protein
MGIGTFVTRRDEVPLGRRLVVLGGYVAAGVAGHALWNAPWLPAVTEPTTAGEWLALPFVLAIRGMPLLILVAVAVRAARRRERRWLDRALAGEVALDHLTAEDAAVLRAPRRRREEARAMRARAGQAAASLLQRLRREQINLAMIATRVSSSDDPALVAQRGYCRSLRHALEAIPGAVTAGAEG